GDDGPARVYRGEPEGTKEARDSLEEFRAVQDRRGEGAALSVLGEAHLFRGDDAAAEDYLQQALAIRREVRDRPGEGNDLGILGQAAQLRHGDYAAGEGYLQQSLAIARYVYDLRREGM